MSKPTTSHTPQTLLLEKQRFKGSDRDNIEYSSMQQLLILLAVSATFDVAFANDSPFAQAPMFTADASYISSSSELPQTRILEERYQHTGWMADYSIQFQGCHTIPTMPFDDRNNNNNNNNQANAAGSSSMVTSQLLARFHLCKKGKCSRSCYGDYVTSLREFVNGYTESKMNEAERACENVRENCNCQYANDDQACEYQCYVSAGLSNCVDQNNQDNQYQDEFEVQSYLECTQMQVNNNNNNNNVEYDAYGNIVQYYIGPYCSSNGKHVYLGIFTDAMCTTPAPKGTYEKYNYYGNSLPYSNESLISTSECIDCEDTYNQNNQNMYGDNYAGNNNYGGNGYTYDDREILEVCQRSYESSAKCEKGMGKIIPYPQTTDCHFVKSTIYKQAGESAHPAATFFALLFAFTTIGLAIYASKLKTDPNFGGSTNDVISATSGFFQNLKSKLRRRKQVSPPDETQQAYAGFT